MDFEEVMVKGNVGVETWGMVCSVKWELNGSDKTETMERIIFAAYERHNAEVQPSSYPLARNSRARTESLPRESNAACNLTNKIGRAV